jgi:hypothetical protein
MCLATIKQKSFVLLLWPCLFALCFLRNSGIRPTFIELLHVALS